MEINYAALLPEMILAVTGLLIMLAVPRVGEENQSRLGYAALLGIGLAVVPVVAQWGQRGGTGFSGMVFQDDFGHFCKLLFLFASAAVVVISISYLEEQKLPQGEYFVLVVFSTIGMCLMATSADLIMTFVGLEVLSIATYILAAFRRVLKSAESAWKYFILGVFSTAFLLYGIAFIYGATGSTRYVRIAEAIQASGAVSPGLFLGLALLLVGFGFKAALVPFHVWTPDVYEGAPVPITAHLAVASKAAAFVTLLRVLQQVVPDLSEHWQIVLWAMAVSTMALGNIVALTQTNIKRMLAYSSIAHAGYLLVGLTAHNRVGNEAVLYYLASYTFMTLGAFTVVQILAKRGERYVDLADFAGVGSRCPFLGVSLAVFLISMAGIPATAGFMGKLFLFSAAIQGQWYGLVVLALVASAIGLYYYLRVIVFMFMRDPERELSSISLPLAARITIVVMVFGTFFLGLFPSPFLQLVSEATNF
ncbi:MAG: NADH-quinone oxidoreductase subunit N [Acidobacteriota bacterium]